MTMKGEIEAQIAALEQRLAELDRQRETIAANLQQLRSRGAKGSTEASPQTPLMHGSVNTASSSIQKIALLRDLFRGREDVFPRRWENSKTGKSGYAPACRNEWVRGVCEKPRIKCSDCPNQAFIPVADDVIKNHLLGRNASHPRRPKDAFVAGVYPLLADETCWFLAADFDKQSWSRDVRAFLETCREKGVPAALERSRSGNGGHVWIFFSEPVPAPEARKLGTYLVTETMERCPDIGFDSYDRFFPSQDTMPAGGFGNLIALPLQHTPRQSGNSLFVDDDLRPYQDQWAFLSGIRRMSRSEVAALVEQASLAGRILGVSLPVDDEDEEPWTAPPSRRRVEPPISGELPEMVEVVLSNQVYVDRSHLPPALVNRLIRLAAFQNPDFYAAQAMRLPTFGKPRVISCAELFAKHIALPRGCLDAALGVLNSVGVRPKLRDERRDGSRLETNIVGTLTEEQQTAADALLAHDTGVLAATTAFGKTVIAAKIIAERSRHTLILVHRRQLLDQWLTRLRTFLDIDPERVGVVRGGRRKPTGVIDVALLQSLVRKGVVSDLVAGYDHLVFDECHHLSAVSFESIAREAKAKYVLGLSATVTRKDGHHPIIFMQCGPVRHRVDAKRQAASRPFLHRVIFQKTAFQSHRSSPDERPAIQELYRLLARDEIRNGLILHDVRSALQSGRFPVVITERKDHLQTIADKLREVTRNVIVLRGGMGARERHQVMEALDGVPECDERVIVATGRYLGEGFDDARLDTLFLTMPISWRGTLAQYAGRLHRLHAAKHDVVVYDYVDAEEPLFAKMAAKREAGYRNLGYELAGVQDLFSS